MNSILLRQKEFRYKFDIPVSLWIAPERIQLFDLVNFVWKVNYVCASVLRHIRESLNSTTSQFLQFLLKMIMFDGMMVLTILNVFYSTFIDRAMPVAIGWMGGGQERIGINISGSNLLGTNCMALFIDTPFLNHIKHSFSPWLLLSL